MEREEITICTVGRREGGRKQGREGRKDDPGPVMVSDTLCPAVHILGT